MSKRTKKCPICGAQMPAGAKFCRKCQAEKAAERSARVETLPKQQRPEELRQEKAPKPTETSRWPEEKAPSAGRDRRGSQKHTWQFIAVLAIIVVIIVIAVVLVIQMNRQPEETQESEQYSPVRIINQDGEDITPTQPPVPAENGADTAAQPEEPAQAEPTPTPAPAEAPEAGDEPEDGDFDVTPVSDTVYVTGSGVNLRTGPSTAYDVVASLSKGTELSRTGTTGGWSQVSYNGGVCYVSNTLITTDKPDASAAEPTDYTVSAADDTIIITTSANVRKGPGTDYDVVATLDAGTELSRTGTTGSWSRVVYNGQEVYINNNLFTVKDSSAVTQSGGTLTVAVKANIRSGPGTGYDILGTVDVGVTLTMTGVTGTNWYQVSYNGQTGYIAGNLVTKN